MKRVIGLGAGGSTRVILDVVRRSDCGLDVVGLLDDDPAKVGTAFEGLPVKGASKDLAGLRNEFDEVLICVGSVRDTTARSRLFEYVKGLGLRAASMISPDSLISPRAELGEGLIVMPGVIVNAGARLEDNVFLNTGAIVEHDCRVGHSSFLSPGCVLSGYVTLDRGVFLGSGTVVIGGVTVGARATVGAGSVVTRDIPSDVVAYGNPAHRHVAGKGR